MNKFKEGDLVVDIRPHCDSWLKYGIVFIKEGESLDVVHAWWGKSIEEAFDNRKCGDMGRYGYTDICNVRLFQPKSWKERIENG